MDSCTTILPQAAVFLPVTEQAALAASRWLGRGKNVAADQAAVEAMRSHLNSLPIRGTIVIGEGERDCAPMLFVGEEVGLSRKEDPEYDIAVDPLEGTTLCAENKANSLILLAAGPRHSLLNAPDLYMEKIAVGPHIPADAIDLNASCLTNLQRISQAKHCKVEDLCITVLKRDRHNTLLREIYDSGARVKLIDDGDVLGVLSTCFNGSSVDAYMGSGGAPEGVLAAVGLRCLGGTMKARLVCRNQTEIARAQAMGIKDINHQYCTQELSSSDETFLIATGVSDGDLVQGVTRSGSYHLCNSVPDAGTLNPTNQQLNLDSKDNQLPFAEINSHSYSSTPYVISSVVFCCKSKSMITVVRKCYPIH